MKKIYNLINTLQLDYYLALSNKQFNLLNNKLDNIISNEPVNKIPEDLDTIHEISSNIVSIKNIILNNSPLQLKENYSNSIYLTNVNSLIDADLKLDKLIGTKDLSLTADSIFSNIKINYNDISELKNIIGSKDLSLTADSIFENIKINHNDISELKNNIKNIRNFIDTRIILGKTLTISENITSKNIYVHETITTNNINILNDLNINNIIFNNNIHFTIDLYGKIIISGNNINKRII